MNSKEAEGRGKKRYIGAEGRSEEKYTRELKVEERRKPRLTDHRVIHTSQTCV